ncbi:DUF3224 domain-containing protein [Comamonas humi]
MPWITGTFKVQLRPLATHAQGSDGIGLGRMSIDKQFHGELEGASQGEMLSAGTPVQGSAGYVAMEQVRGTLAGRSGSFVLQHFGTMDRGQPRLVLEVVADSGTGELAGLRGTMAIRIEDGQHFYDFDYALP